MCLILLSIISFCAQIAYFGENRKTHNHVGEHYQISHSHLVLICVKTTVNKLFNHDYENTNI